VSDEYDDHPRYIVPVWPNEPFVLLAERDKIEYGPFRAGDFVIDEDNALYYLDGASHPITLRVSLQAGDLLFTNDGAGGARTYRIVPASAYASSDEDIGALSFDGDPLGVVDRLEQLLRFVDHSPQALTLAGIQEALQSFSRMSDADRPSTLPAVLEGALIAAERFARVGDVIRTTAITLLLPQLLEPDEKVIAISTVPTGASPFDIETDRRVACLRLTRWARPGDERNGLIRDLVKLVTDQSPRRAELYVLGEWAVEVFATDEPIGEALGRSRALREWFTTHVGDLSLPVRAFRDGPGAHVNVIDVGPTLSRLFATS
jgi:hypothetical protein